MKATVHCEKTKKWKHHSYSTTRGLNIMMTIYSNWFFHVLPNVIPYIFDAIINNTAFLMQLGLSLLLHRAVMNPCICTLHLLNSCISSNTIYIDSIPIEPCENIENSNFNFTSRYLLFLSLYYTSEIICITI